MILQCAACQWQGKALWYEACPGCGRYWTFKKVPEPELDPREVIRATLVARRRRDGLPDDKM